MQKQPVCVNAKSGRCHGHVGWVPSQSKNWRLTPRCEYHQRVLIDRQWKAQQKARPPR